jgi:hypothetical protein
MGGKDIDGMTGAGRSVVKGYSSGLRIKSQELGQRVIIIVGYLV